MLIPNRFASYLFLALLAAPLLAHSMQPSSNPATNTGAEDVDFEQLREDFFDVAISGTSDERRAAVSALVDSLKPEVSEVLSDAYRRQQDQLLTLEPELLRLEYALERRTVMLSNLESLAKRNEDLKDRVSDLRNKVNKLSEEVKSGQRKRKRGKSWSEILVEGGNSFYEQVGASKARKLRKGLGETAQEASDLNQRLGDLRWWGAVGGAGTAESIHKAMKQWYRERLKSDRSLPKLVKEVRAMEKRMQEEAVRTGGRTGQDTAQLYAKAKREANSVRTLVTDLELLLECGVDSAAHALASEPEEERGEAVADLINFVRKDKTRLRLYTLELLGRTKLQEVRDGMRAVLTEAKDVQLTRELIENLGSGEDAALEELLLQRFLVHEEATVRGSAALALASMRSKAAVPILIERLDQEEGRMRSDLGKALTRLTQKSFNGKAELWRRWWKDNSEGFEVPAEDGEVEENRSGVADVGVTFFGIRTESQRVLFVLDVSGSMNYTMAPRPNLPDGDPRWQPKEGETARLTVARRDLLKALGGLRENALFNLVFYASDVWAWQDELVEMDPETRSEAIEFINSIEAVGGTNIYGAMERALDLAGAGDSTDAEFSAPEIDTIYLMTDGQPSVGLSVDPDEIVEMVARRNRTAGIVIHTIGLSDGHDAALLRRLAEQNGGTYVGR